MAFQPKFSFVPLPNKVNQTLSDKENQENLLKWGLKGLLKVTFFNFNQEFKVHDKQDFVESFFRDSEVVKAMEVLSESNAWVPLNTPAERVEFISVPCSETSMKFFDKLKNDENGIVRAGYVTECMDEYVDGMILQDNLKQMLVIEEHSARDLYSDAEKQQFIFHLFKHICLGGAYCQRSPKIQPYLDLTRCLYKELVSVEKVAGTNGLRVRSVVLKIVSYSPDGSALVPREPEHPQNFLYLVIDPVKRQVAVLYHQFGNYAV